MISKPEGSGGGAIEFSERMYELWYKGAVKQASVYAIPSGTIGTLASEISMAYDFHGFSHLISTGCTSSTDAIGYACRNLKLGVIDYVITGGADAAITEGIMTGHPSMPQFKLNPGQIGDFISFLKSLER